MYLIDGHSIGKKQTGNETWMRNVVVQLAALGAKAAVVCQPEAVSWVEQTTGFRAIPAPSSGLRLQALDLPRLAKELGASAILTQYQPSLSSRRAVVIVHDLSPFHAQGPEWMGAKAAYRTRLSIWLTAQRAKAVLFPTEFAKGTYVERFPRAARKQQLLIAPNAVADDLRAAGAVEQHSDDDHTVLCVGTLVPRKNLEVVVDAVLQLRRNGTPARLVIAGGAPHGDRGLQQSLIDRGGDAVDVLGYVDDDQLVECYRQATVFCFPSLYEGFGIPVLEAMAFGVPVITSDAAALIEVGGDATTIVPAHDVQRWADAIGALLTDEALRKQHQERGRARVEHYQWADAGRAALEALGG